MPIRKTNEQKLVFTLSKNTQGKLKINMVMNPKMAKDEPAFRKLPVYMQEMQSAAASIGKLVMKGLAEEEEALRKSNIKPQ